MKQNLRFLAAGALIAATTGFVALADGDGLYRRAGEGHSEKGGLQSGCYVASPKSADYFSTNSGKRHAAGPSTAGERLYYAYPEASDFNKYTIIDRNEDGHTWESPGLYGMSYSGGSATIDADDWCILPPVTLDDVNVFYNFYCQARGAMDANYEDFDVCIGRTDNIDQMTPIIQVRDMTYHRNMELYEDFEKNFIISEPGTYYFAFHAISPADACAFYVRNITISKTGVYTDSPAQVGNLEIQPDNRGDLKATVSFTMPLANNLDVNYDANASITATVTSPAQTLTVTGAPGSQQSVTVKTQEGENIITVLTSYNGHDGLPVSGTANCGLDIPGSPRNITGSVSEDNMKFTMTWDAPTEGANGGFINPDDMYYLIYKYNENTETWTYIDYAYSTEYTATVKPSEKQQLMTLGVAAVNAKDEETPEKLYAIAEGVIGRPYSTPFIEEFRVGSSIYTPVYKDVPSPEYDTYLWFGDPGVGLGRYADLPGRNCYIAFSRQAGRTSYSRTVLPKISTQDLDQAQASFYIYINYETPKTEFYITDFSGKETLLGSIDQNSGNGGWTTFNFEIPEEYLGQRWVNFIIKGEYDDGWGQFMTLGGYELTKVMDHDLAVASFTGDAALSSEETGYYTITVENRGRYEETANLKASALNAAGQTLAEFTLMDNSDGLNISAGEKAVYHFQYSPTDEHSGTVTLRFEILNEDERDDNNSMDFTVNVSKANRPEVDEFQLTGTPGNAQLTWGTPVIHFHDSFEDYEAFSYDQYIGAMLNYDEDGLSTFTFNGLSNFPGSEAPKAWQVFSVSKSGIVGSNYQAPDGDQYLIAFGPYDSSAASDWLVPPMIKGGSDFSFKMNIVGDYDEYLDVMYAVKEEPNFPTDFRILESITKTTFGWEEYSFELPPNAHWVGLHYVSADCFGVMVDELDYKVEFIRDIQGHNIYRNGQLIASNVPGYSYTDPNGQDGDRYQVAVSYYNVRNELVEGYLSEGLLLMGSGVNDIEGAPVAVSIIYTTAAGVRVENPDKGVYIRTTVFSDGSVKTEKVIL